MTHGSVVELDRDGAPQRWLSPDGAVVAEIAADRLRISLTGVHDRPISVEPLASQHPVLGEVHAIRAGDSELARVAAVDWQRPARIPAIDAPARVPTGAGTTLLNVLALGGHAAGRRLRYVGPYPTAALWASLHECFVAEAGATEARFTAGVLERALLGDVAEVPIDFVPAPFERVQVAPRAVVHLRDGVERLYLGGATWAPHAPVRRLLRDGDRLRAVLWLAGAEWAEVAALDGAGRLLDGPHPLPPVLSSVLGKAFPAALAGALGELIAADEPPLLAAAVREVVRDVPIVWGDPGADAARTLAGVLVVHAGLWERLAGASLTVLAEALAAALAPAIKLLGQQRLETVPVGAAVH